MKKSCYILLILLQVSCKNQYFTKVNKLLDSDYPRKSNKIIKSSFEVRKKMFELGHLSFITEKDTIFFLDDYDLPSATHYGSIWTSNKSFHYSLSNDGVTELSKAPLESGILSLVSKWDTTEIRKESEINYNKLNSSHLITAYQVYKKQEHIITNKITFRPFY